MDSLVGTVLNLKQYIVDSCFAEILTEEIVDENDASTYIQPGSAGYDRLTSIAMDAVKNNRDVSGRGKSVLQRQALKYFKISFENKNYKESSKIPSYFHISL